jgi:hypothetical protein
MGRESRLGPIGVVDGEVCLGEVSDKTDYIVFRADGVHYYKQTTHVESVQWSRCTDLGITITTVQGKHPRLMSVVRDVVSILSVAGAVYDSGTCRLVASLRNPHVDWSPRFTPHGGRGYSQLEASLAEELVSQIASFDAPILADPILMICCIAKLSRMSSMRQREVSMVVRGVIAECRKPRLTSTPNLRVD